MPQTPSKTKQRFRETTLQGATATNHETGEIVDLGEIRALAPVTPKRNRKRKEIKFMLVNIEVMPRLGMSRGEWSLFWHVVQYTDRERGDARVSTQELAEALGVIASNASRTLGRLRDRNILIRERQGVWRVNPRLLTRQSVEKWEVDMEDAPEIDWEGSETDD